MSDELFPPDEPDSLLQELSNDNYLSLRSKILALAESSALLPDANDGGRRERRRI